MFGLGGFAAFAQTSDNVAYADERVRFTVISDGAVRMEYAPDGRFVDAKSLLAVERRYAPVDCRVRRGSWVEISTARMTLRYKRGSGPFTADNLQIRSAAGADVPFVWRPGQVQTGNLKGTARTLDGFDGDERAFGGGVSFGSRLELEDGLLATDGWTFIDDSDNYLFDDNPEWEWVTERPKNGGQDWYFMAYGHDYKAALRDFTLFAGKIPLPPRFAFGFWWSRWWAYSDHELRAMLSNFERCRIPLDVLVVDMDWHHTRAGQGGWTGWTWNEELFPDYRKFLEYVGGKGLKVTLNLHPSQGVRPFEAAYGAMAQDLGVDPATQKPLEWATSDKAFIESLFRRVLDPYREAGVGFWWLDWQQAIYDKRLTSLNNTWWLNYMFFSHMEKQAAERPLLYHRWGGLGNHRYQIGFAGDALISWKSLAFQPYFNTTASNVLYGYWSQDIGGFRGDRVDPELYVRWMQFGAYSPIMRTHSTKNENLNKELWSFESKYADALRRAIADRYAMAPYIYTMARKAHDEALPLCRPMYYDSPEAPEAYDCRNQYMFGDALLVAPVVAPAVRDLSTVEVWLPEGRWYEWATGTMLDGGRRIARRFTLEEYPVYAKAGAIVPLHAGETMNLRGLGEDMSVVVFPGGDSGEFMLYEDNGDDTRYEEEYAVTPLSYERSGRRLTVRIGAREGGYAGMPAERRFEVRVLSSAWPQSVTVDGRPAEYEYDGATLAVAVKIPETACDREKVVELVCGEVSPALASARTGGLKARIGRLAERMIDLKFRKEALITYSAELAPMGSMIEELTYHPERLEESVALFEERYGRLIDILERQPMREENRYWLLQAIGWRAE